MADDVSQPSMLQRMLDRLRGRHPSGSEQREESVAETTPAVTPSGPQQLLTRAAECYLRANWLDDASRVFLELRASARAAPCLEQLERWPQAAAAYADCQQWLAAARCWRRVERFAQAAECLERANEFIDAAWLFANHEQAWERATALLARVTTTDADTTLGIHVVQARIAVGGQRSRGAKNPAFDAAEELLQNVLGGLSSVPLSGRRNDILERALVVVDLVRRPDLSRRAHLLTEKFRKGPQP